MNPGSSSFSLSKRANSSLSRLLIRLILLTTLLKSYASKYPISPRRDASSLTVACATLEPMIFFKSSSPISSFPTPLVRAFATISPSFWSGFLSDACLTISCATTFFKSFSFISSSDTPFVLAICSISLTVFPALQSTISLTFSLAPPLAASFSISAFSLATSIFSSCGKLSAVLAKLASHLDSSFLTASNFFFSCSVSFS